MMEEGHEALRNHSDAVRVELSGNVDRGACLIEVSNLEFTVIRVEVQLLTTRGLQEAFGQVGSI